MYRSVDVLGFAGGMTLGAVQAGFELVGKRELPGGFGVDNCEANRHLLGSRWTTEIGPAESWSPVEVEYMHGNPPCSGFSGMTVPSARGIDAKVNDCMWAFVEYAARCRPTIASFESVRQAYTNGQPLMVRLRARLEELTGWRYNLYHVIHDAYELGGTAIRKRYFFVVVRDDHEFGVRYPDVRKWVLRDAWQDLDGLEQTWEKQPYRRPPTEWSATHVRKEGSYGVDGHVGLNTMATQRIMDTLQMARERNGGWPIRTSIATMLKTLYTEHGHLPPSWDYRVDRLVAKDFDMGFTIPYRWAPDRAARVIVGGALNLVVHPWEDRLITHREAARIMGFPDDWTIKGIPYSSALPLTWGKGITTMCGKWIGTAVKNALDGNPDSNSGTQIGDREWVIEPTLKYGRVVNSTNDIVAEEGMTHV